MFFSGTLYSIQIKVINRNEFEPELFLNQPSPLKIMLGEWNRPETHVYTFNSIDQEVHGAKVIYELESGEIFNVFFSNLFDESSRALISMCRSIETGTNQQ